MNPGTPPAVSLRARAWILGALFAALMAPALLVPAAGPLALPALVPLHELLRLGPRLRARDLLAPLGASGLVTFAGANLWLLDLARDFGAYACIWWLFVATGLTAVFTLVLFSAARLHALSGLPLWLLLPLAWSAQELFQSLVGCPFGTIARALTDFPWCIQFIDLTGPLGAGVLACLLAGLAVACAAAPLARTRRAYAIAISLILAAVSSYDLIQYDRYRWNSDACPVDVCLVSTAIPKGVPCDPPTFAGALNAALDDLGATPSGHAQLVVFPECTLPGVTKQQDERIIAWPDRPERDRSVAIATGALTVQRSESSPHFNSVLILDGLGAVHARYDKRDLTLIGERSGPWGWLPGMSRTPGAQAFLHAGQEPGVVALPSGLRAGFLVCSEIIGPDHAARLRREGAEILVNPCNDSWFRFSRAPHAAEAVLRAVELRVAVLRAANSGRTFAVLPSGQCVATPPGELGVLSLAVPRAEAGAPTCAALHSELIRAAASTGGLLVLVFSLGLRKGNRRRNSAPAHAQRRDARVRSRPMSRPVTRLLSGDLP